MTRISAAQSRYEQDEAAVYEIAPELHAKPRLRLYVDPYRDQRMRLRKKRLLQQRVMAFIVLTILFTGSVMVVSQMARLNDRSKTIATLQESIDNLRRNQKSLVQRLEMQQDLRRVENAAVHRLGMQTSTDGQLRVVSIETGDVAP